MSIVFLDTEFSRLPTPRDSPNIENRIELLSAAFVPHVHNAPAFYVELDVELPQDTSDLTRDTVIPLFSTSCHHIAQAIGRERIDPIGCRLKPQLARGSNTSQAFAHVSSFATR